MYSSETFLNNECSNQHLTFSNRIIQYMDTESKVFKKPITYNSNEITHTKGKKSNSNQKKLSQSESVINQ